MPSDPDNDRPGAGQRWGLLAIVLVLVTACVIFVDRLMGWLLGR